MTVSPTDRRPESHHYRPDIDGLRAIAVISVLMFHLNVSPFGGGFVGVDIFFVISGYLITGVIYDELQRDKFSLSNFYVRRVRRIFPALYLTIALTLAAAVVVFEPYEMQQLFDPLRYLSVFQSNLYFMRAGGYFDAPIEANLLLQTWSLSVEEQFYLFFPVLLLLAQRFVRPYMRSLILTIAVISLAVGAVRLNLEPQKTFFATEVRVFELMIGAIVALGFRRPLDRPATRTAVATLGFVTMIGSVFFLSSTVPFPGPNALPVCVGTALIIWAGERGGTTFINRMLAWRPLVGIGLISYSVYLLHWPILVLAKRILLAELMLVEKGVLAIASLGAGYLSWRFIETPFRRAGPTPSARVFGTAVGLIAVLGLGSIGAIHLIRLPPTDVFEAAERSRRIANADPCLLQSSMLPGAWRAEICVTGDKGKLIAVWGDSYAAHYFDAFRNLAAKSGTRLVLFGSGSCPPAVGLELKERPSAAISMRW